MLLLLLLRRLCLAPARWTLLRLLAPVPRLPLQVLFLLRMRLCPASRSGFLPLSEPFGVWWCCAAAPTEGCFCLQPPFHPDRVVPVSLPFAKGEGAQKELTTAVLSGPRCGGSKLEPA